MKGPVFAVVLISFFKCFTLVRLLVLLFGVNNISNRSVSSFNKALGIGDTCKQGQKRCPSRREMMHPMDRFSKLPLWSLLFVESVIAKRIIWREYDVLLKQYWELSSLRTGESRVKSLRQNIIKQFIDRWIETFWKDSYHVNPKQFQRIVMCF